MSAHPTNEVFEKVADALEQTVTVERTSLTPASRLAADLRVGRFARIRLALYLEETFDIELPDEDVLRFDTVDDIVRYMSRWSLGTVDLAAEQPQA